MHLQGIGTFILDAAIPDAPDSDKPVVIPSNSVTFTYDKKAKEDDNLISYIVENTGKIRSLASADLDSFLSLGKQFLNIGKPFVLPNLGTLEKTNTGELVFKGGEMIAQKIEPNKIKIEEAEEDPEEASFSEYTRTPGTGKRSKALFIIIGLLALAAIGWTVWEYGFRDRSTETTSLSSTGPIQPQPDSTAVDNRQDSLKNQVDSAAAPRDAYTFKVVVNEYHTPDAANARLLKLKSYRRNVIMYTNDSAIYKVAEPFTRPLSDTTRVLDSLKRYYTKIYLEK